MIVEDQSRAEAFLKQQQARLDTTGNAAVVTTHISKVFLAGGRAFKLKRAVRFAYVDFSTPELRLAACERELALNRRTAPSLYLGVRRITRAADGTIDFDAGGTLIDAVVEMRRFDQACLFDALALRGALTERMIADLAHRIAAFHATAEISTTGGGAAGMEAVLDINERSMRATGLALPDAVDDISSRFRAALRRHDALLDRRRDAGKVRRCHGDLILRNICLMDGMPMLFDCLEFNEDLATIDVLYDLAFLIMDLLHRGQAGHANVLFNRYLDEADESDGLALVAFFTAVRAAVRAHVTAAQVRETAQAGVGPVAGEAADYFSLASTLLARPAPSLLAIGGRSGTGKSTIAAALAPMLGLAPGARVLSSDRIRKRLHGVRPERRLPPDAYAPEVSARVYAAMRDEALRAVRAGSGAIADAVFDRQEDRDAIESVAREAGVPFHGVWLDAPVGTAAARIESRRDNPSDATVEVLHRQLQHDPGTVAWYKIDAGRTVSAIVADALASIAGETALSARAIRSPIESV